MVNVVLSSFGQFGGNERKRNMFCVSLHLNQLGRRVLHSISLRCYQRPVSVCDGIHCYGHGGPRESGQRPIWSCTLSLSRKRTIKQDQVRPLALSASLLSPKESKPDEKNKPKFPEKSKMPFNRDSLNLEKQFTFYASYHNNWANIAIHLLCIWPILATALCLLQYTPAIVATPEAIQQLPFGHLVVVNGSLIFALIYMLAYPVMEPFVGSVGSVLVASIYLTTSSLVMQEKLIMGHPLWQAALAVHVGCWVLQFIGHGVFEGRAPALLDSLDQALLTAPLFVLMEVFFFFGYRPQFHSKIMKQVEKNVKEFQRKNKQK